MSLILHRFMEILNNNPLCALGTDCEEGTPKFRCLICFQHKLAHFMEPKDGHKKYWEV